MTFFDKLFTSKNKLFKCDGNIKQTSNKSSDACFDIDLDKVRVVLFRECERRGRKLLFDSDAVEKIGLGCSMRHVQHSDVVETSQTHAYRYKKPNRDVTSVGEMIFGSVALASKGGCTSKIHNIPSPSRLLFTTVLPTSSRCHPIRHCRTSSTADSSDSLLNAKPSGLHRSSASNSLMSLNGCENKFKPCPLLSPDDCCESRLSHDTQSAPGSRRSSSFFSSLTSMCESRTSITCSGGSLNSLRRRWNQSLAVSLDLSSCDESDDSPIVRVRTKLGLALVLNIAGPYETDLEKFLLNNSLTLESILERLRHDVEAAYQRVDTFVQLTYSAYEKTALAILEIIKSRQDLQPRWLKPILAPNRCQRSNLSTRDQFVSMFCGILREFESKTTNFFMSTLLTAVLTHNLSWVSSVAAQISDTDHRHDTQPVKVYNPLWAQHSEFFGMVSTPARAAKIVLADPENKPSLSDIQHIILYFLRSSTVIEHNFKGNFVEIAKDENDVEKAWTADDNFDSGVDCEMRDIVVASCSNPKIEQCREVLVQSCAKPSSFVENLKQERKKNDCCNSLENTCKKSSLYPDIKAIALLENVRIEDLTSERDRKCVKSPTPDEGYETIYDGNLIDDVKFTIGEQEKSIIVTKSLPIEAEFEILRRSNTVNIPIIQGLKILQNRSKTMENVADECKIMTSSDDNLAFFTEIPMPCCPKPESSKALPPCPVLGCLSQNLQPHHAIQAVGKKAEDLEEDVRLDLAFMASSTGLGPVLAEAVYVVADLQKWAVSVHSSQRTTLGTPRAVRAAASQLVADMLESFNHLHHLNFPSNFCLDHLEKKLQEIYRKSQAVAELLMTTEFCTVDILTCQLQIAVNDVPLLLSVATTHTPQIGEKYGISFS